MLFLWIPFALLDPDPVRLRIHKTAFFRLPSSLLMVFTIFLIQELKKARFQCDKCPYAATKAHDLKRHVKARHLKVSGLLYVVAAL
jgi:hypothetical protein